jgi:hypothetical protein
MAGICLKRVSYPPARLLLVLILALGVQTAYANPAIAAAELRALSCCAGHCTEPLSLPSAKTCCGVTATASGPAEAPSAPGAAPLAPSGPPCLAAVTSPAPVQARLDLMPLAGSGPPTFLAQRHLLI